MVLILDFKIFIWIFGCGIIDRENYRGYEDLGLNFFNSFGSVYIVYDMRGCVMILNDVVLIEINRVCN